MNRLWYKEYIFIYKLSKKKLNCFISSKFLNAYICLNIKRLNNWGSFTDIWQTEMEQVSEQYTTID